MASRLQVATYVADHMVRSRAEAVRAAAAWLLEHGEARQARYLARDIAQIQANRGYVYARVTTAQSMNADARTSVERFIREATDAHEIELETVVDPEMIGGITIETPGQVLDASVRTKLARYVEGVAN